ncbi:MAG: tetratricopeptide repeat protein [Planctomycetota bacterium]|jgi:tetratricopeptide (TPR) repeat protein
MIRLASLIVLLAAAQAVTAPELLRQARDAFAGQRYAETLDLYDQLRQRHPQEAGIPYNMGVAAYRQGDLQRAAKLFDEARALAGDPALRARSAYNLGTTAYRKSLEQPQDPAEAASQLGDATGDLEQALEHFREAIDADPEDLDAKANGELAYRWLEQLRQMQEQMQQQQQQQGQQQPQDQPQQQQPQPQDQPQQQQDQQQQEQQQEQKAAQAQQEQQVAGDERDEAAQRKPMSREEAQRLLQQVRDKERQRQEELARREAGRRPPVDKDW